MFKSTLRPAQHPYSMGINLAEPGELDPNEGNKLDELGEIVIWNGRLLIVVLIGRLNLDAAAAEGVHYGSDKC